MSFIFHSWTDAPIIKVGEHHVLKPYSRSYMYDAVRRRLFTFVLSSFTPTAGRVNFIQLISLFSCPFLPFAMAGQGQPEVVAQDILNLYAVRYVTGKHPFDTFLDSETLSIMWSRRGCGCVVRCAHLSLYGARSRVATDYPEKKERPLSQKCVHPL